MLNIIAGFSPAENESWGRFYQAMIVLGILLLMIYFVISYWLLPKIANKIYARLSKSNQKKLQHSHKIFRTIFFIQFVCFLPYLYWQNSGNENYFPAWVTLWLILTIFLGWRMYKQNR